MKRSFFQAAVVSILLYGCTTWTLTKRLKKKLDGNYTRMLRVILNKPWQQHPTRHQLYGHLPPITKAIQVRRTRHAGHCWRSKDELISDVLLWTSAYDLAKAGRPARTYIQQLCEDTGCSPEDLPEAMNDREKWRERVRDIHASGTTWWWWWFYLTSASRCNSLNKKGPKKLYKRRQQQMRDEDVSFIFSFISWVQHPFYGWGSFPWVQLKWLNPPVKVSKNTLVVFAYACPHLVFKAFIRVNFFWKFVKVQFLSIYSLHLIYFFNGRKFG